jgi:uridine monophosphate synthetase
MDEKQTNLAVSADVTSAQELLDLADLLGSQICILKTHIDIIKDFTASLTQQLQQLAKTHAFLLFEDRKFADIGQTVKEQYQGGIYQIADWADLINAHSLPGSGIIQGLVSGAAHKKNRGCLLLAEMSAAGHLMDQSYQQQTLKMAESFSDFVIGFITQHALSPDPRWIYLTPGINLNTKNDTLGQQYLSPQKAILENGSDIIIVGRGIIHARDPKSEAEKYRQCGWESYLSRTLIS